MIMMDIITFKTGKDILNKEIKQNWAGPENWRLLLSYF